MKRTIITILFSLLLGSLFSQNLIFTIQGTLKDMYLGIPVRDANVKLIRSDGKAFDTLTDGYGFFKFDTSIVLENHEFSIIVSGRNYIPGKSTESTWNYKVSTAFVHDFEMWSGCAIPETYLIPFDSLSSANCYTVNTLFIALADNPNLELEFISIQNKNSKNKYGQILKNWLIESGIDEKRLSTSIKYVEESERYPSNWINHIRLEVLSNTCTNNSSCGSTPFKNK